MGEIINKIKYYISFLTRKTSANKLKIKIFNVTRYIYVKSNLTYCEKKHNKNTLYYLTTHYKYIIICRFLKNHNLFSVVKKFCGEDFFIKKRFYHYICYNFDYNLIYKLYDDGKLFDRNIKNINNEWNEFYESLM